MEDFPETLALAFGQVYMHMSIFYTIIYVTLPTYLSSEIFSNDAKYCNELQINHKPTFNHVTSVGLFTYLKPNFC